MNETCNEDADHVVLKVHKSAISSIGSGVARINQSYLDCFEDHKIEMVELRAGKKHKVVKLVSDRFAKKGHVVLREGDMEDLEVKEGDEIELHPYKKLSQDMKENWQKFKDRFHRKPEEDEEEGK
ncbi:MAG: hypothetical protein JXA22_06060 [Candidatus Thermoplasmatota archaeon]|nr:hypothetical protein [Candidatus Thermoplasmatota archaeon]